jgi:phosphomannomutase
VAATEEMVRHHLKTLVEHIDADVIARAGLKVAVDCCNGACSRFSPGFIEDIGCEVVPINTDIGQPFPHEPAPGPNNLGQLRALAAAARADVGFAHDADGDRLGIVTEEGEAPGEEVTLCLAAESVLRRGEPGPVVTNVSTTRVAGEGSGGVMFPRINCAHDSIAAMAHIIELMARSGKSVGELVRQLPRFQMAKLTIPCPPERVSGVIETIRREAEEGTFGGEIDMEDGVKVSDADSWVHVRASMTEPLIRVISEATTKEAADDLAERFARRVRQALV